MFSEAVVGPGLSSTSGNSNKGISDSEEKACLQQGTRYTLRKFFFFKMGRGLLGHDIITIGTNCRNGSIAVVVGS